MKTDFDQRLYTGRKIETTVEVTKEMVERFAEFSGDYNPIHLDPEEAKSYGYHQQVAHGAILIAHLSKVIGMEAPGAGAVWMNQSIEWLQPVFVGERIKMTVIVEKISTGAGILTLDVAAENEKGKLVMKGKSNVKLAEKINVKTTGQKKSEKTVLVTGASRGIGAAIARRLAAEGYRVAIQYHQSQNTAETLQDEIKSEGGEAAVFQGDVTQPESLERMLIQIKKTFGDLDIIVHGASPAVETVKAYEMTYKNVEKYLKAYVGGAVSLVTQAAPAMIQNQFGRIIFIGTSYLFGAPPAGLASYVTAKEALWGYAKSLAQELGPHGITVNMVSPGMTVTDFTSDIPARLKEIEARKSSMRRLADAADTANLVCFIAGSEAGYLNGVHFPVTGSPV